MNIIHRPFGLKEICFNVRNGKVNTECEGKGQIDVYIYACITRIESQDSHCQP